MSLSSTVTFTEWYVADVLVDVVVVVVVVVVDVGFVVPPVVEVVKHCEQSVDCPLAMATFESAPLNLVLPAADIQQPLSRSVRSMLTGVSTPSAVVAALHSSKEVMGHANGVFVQMSSLTMM